MSNLPEHQEWPSIQRLSSETITITEKIDGTNGCIYVPGGLEALPILAGSRSRWLTNEDNFGFRAWVDTNAETLRHLGPGYHHGEWYGSGIQRRYGLTEKRFISFEWWRDDLPACMSKVPILYQGDWSATLFDEQVQRLREGGSLAVPGFMDPEGIVIQFKSACARTAKFKKYCKNDLVPKSRQVHKAAP